MKKLILFFLLVISVIGAGISVTNATASAKTKYAKTVPVSLRGSWYQLQGDAGAYRLIFSKGGYQIAQGFGPKWSKREGRKINSTFTITNFKNKSGYYHLQVKKGSLSYLAPTYFKIAKVNGKRVLKAAYTANPKKSSDTTIWYTFTQLKQKYTPHKYYSYIPGF